MSLSVALGLSRVLGVLRISGRPSNWMYDPYATLSSDVTEQASTEGNTKTSSKASKAKAGKEKTKHKRAATAYNLYMKDALAQRYNPGLTHADIFRESARNYRHLTDAEKQKYKDVAAKAKQEHLAILRAEAGPKRALSAYNLYIREEMPNRPKDQPGRGWMKTLAAQYKTLPADRLEALKSLAKKDSDRYAKEKEMIPEKPKKPKAKGLTGYNVFAREKLKAPTSKNVIENMKHAGEEWKSLSDDDKKKYKDVAAKENGIFEASNPPTSKKKVVGPASNVQS